MSTYIPAPTKIAASVQPLELKPSERLTQRASLSIVASLLDYFAKVAVGLLLTPILLAVLGRALFGVWEMLGRLIGYMSVTDGRPTEALRLLVANQQENADSYSKRRYVGGALGVWLIFLPLLIIAGVFLVWLSPIVGRVPAELHGTVRLTAALLVLNFVLLNLTALPESVLRGMNLSYKRMGLQGGLSIVGGLITAVALYIGAGLVGVAAAQVALTCLTGILFWYVVKKYVPWFGIAKPTRADLRRLLALGTWNTAGTFLAKLHLASDVIILGVITSSSTVTTYILTGYAAQAVTGILTLGVAAVTPGLGGLIGSRQYRTTAELRGEMIAINWLLVISIGSTILMTNRSFLQLWVGEQHYAGPLANLLIILIMTQTTFIRSDAYVIDATLKMRDRVVASGIAALFSIALSILLTPSYGIEGLCIGVLAGRSIQTLSYPFLINSCLGLPEKPRLMRVLRPAMTMCLCFAGGAFFGERFAGRNWFEWLGCVAVTFVLSLFLAFTIGLSTDSRVSVMNRITKIRQSARWNS